MIIMAKKVVATCPNCGHNSIVRRKHFSIGGAIAGAAIGSVVTVEFGPVAIGGAVTGAAIGFLVGTPSSTVTCPECGKVFDRPEQ